VSICLFTGVEKVIRRRNESSAQSRQAEMTSAVVVVGSGGSVAPSVAAQTSNRSDAGRARPVMTFAHWYLAFTTIFISFKRYAWGRALVFPTWI